MSNLSVSKNSDGEETNCVVPILGAGNQDLKYKACGDNRAAGITLPGNWSRINCAGLAGLTRVVKGSKMGLRPLKLPLSSSVVGTVALSVVPWRVRAPS